MSSTATPSTTTTILVPDVEERNVLADLPNTQLVTYSPATKLSTDALEATVLVTGSLPPDELETVVTELKHLRLIQTLNAGVDKWTGRVPADVILSNARGAHGGATAEWAATALLCIFRNIPRYVHDQKEHLWRPCESESLAGKRILIIGAGDLANNLKRRLIAFDSIVSLIGRTARNGVSSIDEFPTLLPSQDAVVLMVPLSEETRHLVDADFLSKLPDHAVVVNASRGPVVDTGALLAELQSGRLRAALDVIDPEPLPADHPLWDAPGLFLTPHVGGHTQGSSERAWNVARAQIAQFLLGERPDNTIEFG